jgi:hypothetical protein
VKNGYEVTQHRRLTPGWRHNKGGGDETTYAKEWEVKFIQITLKDGTRAIIKIEEIKAIIEEKIPSEGATIWLGDALKLVVTQKELAVLIDENLK